MNTIHPEQLIAQMNWRYATKQFDPNRKIRPQDWEALEEALRLTPSSCGLQPWKFIVVSDPATRDRLKAVSWGQSQITDASQLVVFAAKTHLTEEDVDDFLRQMAKVRGVAVETLAGFRGMVVGTIVKGMDDKTRQDWASKQAYIALGNLLTSAAMLGIDACPMEGFEPAKYDEILGLPAKNLAAVVVATLGYRLATDHYAAAPKVRFPKEQVFVTV